MIYLDNAATTFPKPSSVTKEITECMNKYCGNAGRSGHFLSIKAAEKIYECREKLAVFFGFDKPENVVFTLNTTYALNLAIKTLYEPKSHILISNMEHNSVLRPINELMKSSEISYSVFNVLQPAKDIIADLEKVKKDDTKMLIMTHASNVCGKVFPIKEVGEFCEKNKITFIVDAAQSAGSIKINVKNCKIGALCAPAHKGLYGPQGLGFVIFCNANPKRIFLSGGNGVNSLSCDMGLELPESFECGTMPAPLAAGLCASLKWLDYVGTESICNHEISLAKMMMERLTTIRGTVLYGADEQKNGIVLFNNRYFSTDALSAFLSSKNICTRNGFHCAPLAHNALGTGKEGAVRISAGFFNTKDEIDKVYKEIKYFCK